MNFNSISYLEPLTLAFSIATLAACAPADPNAAPLDDAVASTSEPVVFMASMTDWSNTVTTTVYRCEWSPAAAHNSASCSVGPADVLVGGGAEIEGNGEPGALLTGSFPLDLTTWHATSKDHVLSYPHRLRAFAAVTTKITWSTTAAPTIASAR